MKEADIGDKSFTISRNQCGDIEDLVAILSDDIRGNAREGGCHEAYCVDFDELSADPNQFLALICDESGRPCGTFQLTVIPGMARRGAKRPQIEALRTASWARGTGLGPAMFAWAHEWGRSRGATLAQLTSDKQRPDAHRFYESLEYTATHEGDNLFF
ncbi:GNAT family N-acetyltransferase [Rothia koreensis]|uniref:GNAT family N-acetyltransferase n=1 Tax=Rothia koreensis TaxID=592378 RepID=UPI001EE85E1D|nr:GNAT family N-acetyltransferase [Rothia koreensis]